MGIRVNTNVQSLAAQRNLSQTSRSQQQSLQRLASGQRINQAADDAAGLAISEKMRASIRSIGQSVRNANDGILMIQTAEGAMNEVGNILVRFRELAVQAASDTIGETERGFVDKEVQQLRQEIDRISAATEYNGRKIVGGEGGELQIQVGINNNPSEDRFLYDTHQTNVSSEALGLSDLSVRDRDSAQENLGKIDDAIKEIGRAHV